MALSLALRLILGVVFAAGAGPAWACRWPVNVPPPDYTIDDLDRVLAEESPVFFTGTVENSSADGVLIRNTETGRGEAPESFLFEAILIMRCFYPITEYRFADFRRGDAVIVFGRHDVAGGFVADELVLQNSDRGRRLSRLTVGLEQAMAE